MNLSQYPGYNSPEFLAEQGKDKYFQMTCVEYAIFVSRGGFGNPAYDIGADNPKIQFIREMLGREIHSLDFGQDDFNRVRIQVPADAKTIFCLSILEHLTNPAFFLENITRNMGQYTTLYLSTPARMGILQNKDCHFHEIEQGKLIRWLLEPAGLTVIRKSKIRVFHPWYFYLMGFRAFLRLFFDYTNIYEIRKKWNQ